MDSAHTVLVVDDDARNRKLLETLLRADGYAVVSADSGHAAIDALSRRMPDVMLLDLMIPGLDGFGVVRQLRADADYKTLPIVIVTALDDPGSNARLEAAGVNAVLHKPIDRWALKAALKRVLGSPEISAP